MRTAVGAHVRWELLRCQNAKDKKKKQVLGYRQLVCACVYVRGPESCVEMRTNNFTHHTLYVLMTLINFALAKGGGTACAICI